jgi:hypothetical protein
VSVGAVMKGQAGKLGSTDHESPTVFSRRFQKLCPITRRYLQMVYNSERSRVSEYSKKVIHRNNRETEREIIRGVIDSCD